MPKQTKTCRVCGAVYEACKTVRTGSAVFNWREVACSPECGMKYLDKVVASRNEEITAEKVFEEPVVMRFPYEKSGTPAPAFEQECDECMVECEDPADEEGTEITE